jgi:hypothetical protein
MALRSKQTAFVDSVKDSMGSSKVFVFCKSGRLPLEWPKVEGVKSVDRDHLAQLGTKAVVVASDRYRAIVTRQEDRGSATSLGYEVLDKANPEDMEFLSTIKDWIKNSGDRRIVRHAVRVEEGNPYAPPFNRWDDLSCDACIATVTNMLGSDAGENQALIAEWIKYELSVDKPNREKLEALDALASSEGSEAYDDEVFDSSVLDA